MVCKYDCNWCRGIESENCGLCQDCTNDLKEEIERLRRATFLEAAEIAESNVAGVSMGEFTDGHDAARHVIAAALRGIADKQETTKETSI